MADRGVASRRDCEKMIEAGEVTVNGKRTHRLPVFVDVDADKILVRGIPLPRPVRPTYVLLHKPPKTLATTRDDPAFGVQRRTLTDLVDHPAKARLFPVGRLEFHASGLVLLMTDGDLAHRLTHPRYGVPRTYEALVKRRLAQEDLVQMEQAFAPRGPQGAAAGGNGVVVLNLLKHDADRSLIEIILREGPNRQVGDVLARLGCPVKKLRRTGIGPLRLKGLAVGAWRELTAAEVRALTRLASGARPAPARKTRRPRPEGIE